MSGISVCTVQSMEESDPREAQEPNNVSRTQRGMFFWNKRCLYIVMVVLVSVVTINLTLVCWLIAVLDIKMHGMSYMHSFDGGIQLTAKSYVQDLLVTAGFKTWEGQTMVIRSVDNLTLKTTDKDVHPSSSIYLGGGTLDIRTPNLTVTGPRGNALFSVDQDTVSLFSPFLIISGEGGAALGDGLQTPVVSADVRSNLALESVLKGVQVSTPAGVSIESRAGDIQISSNQDISFQTEEGSIKLESGSVLVPGLRRVLQHHKRGHHGDRIYQLCVCDDGHLYLGEADAFCDAQALALEFCR